MLSTSAGSWLPHEAVKSCEPQEASAVSRLKAALALVSVIIKGHYVRMQEKSRLTAVWYLSLSLTEIRPLGRINNRISAQSGRREPYSAWVKTVCLVRSLPIGSGGSCLPLGPVLWPPLRRSKGNDAQKCIDQ